jgi:hypothetical protein
MHAHVQRLVSVVELTTMLEGVLPKSSVLFCIFCGQKDPLQRIFIKKCFLFTVGSVCCVKQFTTRSRNSLKDVRKPQVMPNQVRKWLVEQSKDFYAAGFDALVKRWVQVYQCWWRTCLEINVFLNFKYYIFYVLYPSVTCLLTLPHISLLFYHEATF